MIGRYVAGAIAAALLGGPAAAQTPAAPLPENLGAVPAHEAIAAAKAVSDPDGMTVWNDAGIAPLNGGWCIGLVGFNRVTGEPVGGPVFVQQDGTAWRTDPRSLAAYDGGADGYGRPPAWASQCRLEDNPPPLR